MFLCRKEWQTFLPSLQIFCLFFCFPPSLSLCSYLYVIFYVFLYFCLSVSFSLSLSIFLSFCLSVSLFFCLFYLYLRFLSTLLMRVLMNSLTSSSPSSMGEAGGLEPATFLLKNFNLEIRGSGFVIFTLGGSAFLVSVLSRFIFWISVSSSSVFWISESSSSVIWTSVLFGPGIFCHSVLFPDFRETTSDSKAVKRFSSQVRPCSNFQIWKKCF